MSDDARPHGGREWAEAITIGDLLLRSADHAPDRDAVVFPDRRWTYAELRDRAEAVARSLIGAGVRRGDRVGYFMPNDPQTVAMIYGIALAGAIVVPVNVRYRARELPFIVADARLAAIVTSDVISEHVDLPALLHEALPELASAADPTALALEAVPSLRFVACLGGSSPAGMLTEGDLERLAEGVTREALDRRRAGVRIGDPALLLFTSGTTAQPRACRLTHESLVRNWTSFGRAFRMQDGDRVWVPCPMFHLGAIGPTLMTATVAGTLISDRYFQPDRAIDLLAAERPEILFPAYPPISQGVLTHARFDDVDTSRARVILNVGPPALLRQIQERLPSATLMSIYALSEGGGAVTLTSLEDDLETRTTTSGRPLSGTEVQVRDVETDAVCGVDEPGEILIRGVGIFAGYDNDDAKNAATFDADGWARTGDRGALDAAGRLRYLGRTKEMLKVGGENVAQAEIEAHLSTHPAVKIVQVVGVPDARLGEVPAACVEFLPRRAVPAEVLIEHCRGAIASFKVPRYVHVVDEWPMSASKVQKHRLREALLAELGLVED